MTKIASTKKNETTVTKLKPVLKAKSLEEKAVAFQKEIDEALQKEQSEVVKYVNDYLREKGYDISARMILEPGKAPAVQTFIYKINKKQA
jgi:hypothetical protein